VTRRRSLIEGLKVKPKADRRKEEKFVFGAENRQDKPKATPRKAERTDEGEGPPPSPSASTLPAFAGRMPLTTRIRPDFAAALKRASLERQLAGKLPNTVQDILEHALEPWLKDNGYLQD
jgi:hypothetical protein